MIGGVSVPAFQRRFGTKPDNAFPEVADWLSQGLLTQEDPTPSLSPHEDCLLANELFVRLL